jgi:hypothetical protein
MHDFRKVLDCAFCTVHFALCVGFSLVGFCVIWWLKEGVTTKAHELHETPHRFDQIPNHFAFKPNRFRFKPNRF